MTPPAPVVLSLIDDSSIFLRLSLPFDGHFSTYYEFATFIYFIIYMISIFDGIFYSRWYMPLHFLVSFAACYFTLMRKKYELSNSVKSPSDILVDTALYRGGLVAEPEKTKLIVYLYHMKGYRYYANVVIPIVISLIYYAQGRFFISFMAFFIVICIVLGNREKRIPILPLV